MKKDVRKRRKRRNEVIINIDEGDNARWLAILRQEQKKNEEK